MTDKNHENQESTTSSLDLIGLSETDTTPPPPPTLATSPTTFDRIDPKTCRFKDCLIPLIGKDFSVGQRYCRLHLEEGKKRDAKNKAFDQRLIMGAVLCFVFMPFLVFLLYAAVVGLFYGSKIAFEFLTTATGSPVAATILLLSAIAYLISKAVSAISRRSERQRIAKKEAQQARLKAIEEKALGKSEANSSQDKAEPEKTEEAKDGEGDSMATV